MRIGLLAAAMVAGLAGCVSEEQLQAERTADLKAAVEMCHAAGYRQGTSEYSGCVTMMSSRMQDQRSGKKEYTRAQWDRAGQVLSQMEAENQARLSAVPHMQSTTCRPLGNTVHCTTF